MTIPQDQRPFGFLARVSSLEQANRGNIQNYVNEARQFFARMGVDYDTQVHVFLDDGVSGNIPIWQRPDGARLKATVERNLVTEAVYVPNIDRVNREDVPSLYALLDLCNQFDIPLRTFTGIDTSEESGDFMAGVEAVVARYERRKMQKRAMGGRKTKAAKGSWQGGRVPFGFKRAPDNTLELDPAAVSLIHTAWVKIVQEKHTVFSLAKWVNEKGIKSSQGGEWDYTTWYSVLTNPALVGRAEYNKSKSIVRDQKRITVPRPRSEWIIVPTPAVFTEIEWAQLQAAIEENKRVYREKHDKGGTETAATVLHPLAKCLHCGYRYYTFRSKGEDRGKQGYYFYYRHAWQGDAADCKQRNHMIRIEPVNDYVWSAIEGMVMNREKWLHSLDADNRDDYTQRLATMGKAIAETERSLNDLEAAAFIKRTVRMERYDSLAATLNAQLEQSRIEYETLLNKQAQQARQQEAKDALVGVAERLAPLLGSASFAQRQHIVRELIEHIIVDRHAVGEQRYENVFSVKWKLLS